METRKKSRTLRIKKWKGGTKRFIIKKGDGWEDDTVLTK